MYEQAITWATKATIKSKFWKQQIIKPAKDHNSSSKSSRLSLGAADNQLQGSFVISKSA